MLSSISKLSFANNVQSVFSNTAPVVVKNNKNDIVPKTANMSIADMANAIKATASDKKKR